MSDEPINPGEDRQAFDRIILEKFPTPIAVLYQKMLTEENWQVKVDDALTLFETGMKALSLEMMRKYLEQTADRSPDEVLNQILKDKFPRPSLGIWVEIFFRLLLIHRDKPNWFFARELHQVQWDPETKRKKTGVRPDFDSLIQIRNELAHGGAKPFTEEQWQAKYEQVEQHLLQVLTHFLFLQHYQIVYVRQIDDRQADCSILCGLSEHPGKIDLPAGYAINSDTFYLHDPRDKRFFEIRPLFLPWPSEFFAEQDITPQVHQTHLALYQEYKYKPNVENSLSVFFNVVTEGAEKLNLVDQETLSQFLELVVREIEKIRQKMREARRLGWELFKEIAADITAIETQGLQEKFDPKLYYDRQILKTTFAHYLQSDKTAFVLLGASGVGKSNFVLSLAEAYRQEEDTHLIFLNGANLSGDQNLTDTLTALFAQRLRLMDERGERRVTDLLEELDRIPGIRDKTILLAFDAINESPNPNQLLRRINELVSYQNFPWLKVVLTSRPEAWRNMKRRVPLTEPRYYRQPDTLEIEVELMGFDMAPADAETWLTLERFKPFELPEVYENYRKVYKFTTPFKELSPGMKSLLRDPLALRLVAETYQGEALPTNVRVSQLYPEYVSSLVNQGRLERADVKTFLKERILPLMFKAEEYPNKLSDEILSAETEEESGKPLSEKIEIDDILESSGKRVNQAFQNLVDAEILIKQGTYHDYEVSFKYERFYDFYGGEYLFEEARKKPDRGSWYKSLFELIDNAPYLWGPITQALLQEFVQAKENRQYDLVFQLIDPKNVLTRDLVETVLTMFIEDFPEDGRMLLEKFLAKRERNFRQIASRVAGKAGIAEILDQLGSDRDLIVRITNALSTYYFWQNNPAEGWEILRNWANNVRWILFIPNIGIAASAIILSLLIISDNRNSSKPGFPDFQNPKIYLPLQEIWKIILSDLLSISETGKAQPWMKKVYRSLILSLIVRFVIIILRRGQRKGSETGFSPADILAGIFELSPGKRAGFLSLEKYWDVSSEGLEPIEEILRDCFEPENLIAVSAVLLVIQLRSKPDGDQDLAVVERLYNHFFDPKYPTVSPAQLIVGAGFTLTRDQKRISDEAWEIFTQLERRHLDVGGKYHLPNGSIFETSYLDLYTTLEWEKNPDTRPSLLFEYIDKAIRGENAPSLKELVRQIGNLAIARGYMKLALEAAEPIVAMLRTENGNPERREETEQVLGKTLARARLYYRDQVDNFMEEVNPPETLRYIVNSTIVEEDIWDDFIHVRYGALGLRTIFIPQVRDELWKLFELSTTTKSMEQWFNLCLRRIVNFVYGGEVFPVEQPPS